MKIANIYKNLDKLNDQNYLYIGRANKKLGLKKSPLANPFPEWKHGREEAIQLYRHWLYNHMNDPIVRTELNKITEDTILLCYCSPKPCHGDIVIRCVNYLQNS